MQNKRFSALRFWSANPNSKLPNPKRLCLLVIVLGLSLAGTRSQAQQSSKTPRIGILSSGSFANLGGRFEAFRQGLRDLGYVEGKNIVIEWREAKDNSDRLRELANEFVSLKLDVILSPGPAVTRPVKEATSTIPIVMAQDSDPVGNGFVASLARPGGNVTGLATLAPEMAGKQLELLKEIVPKLSRVAIIGNSTIPGDALSLRETILSAGVFEVYLRYLDVPQASELETAFGAATKGHADGLLVLGNPRLNAQRKQVVALAARHRLPAAYTRPEFVDAGGLMYYGTSYNDLFRRAATYVDKILKGAKPADLPVEQPKKFDFFVNLHAAQQIGLKIPPNVLVRADRVIK